MLLTKFFASDDDLVQVARQNYQSRSLSQIKKESRKALNAYLDTRWDKTRLQMHSTQVGVNEQLSTIRRDAATLSIRQINAATSVAEIAKHAKQMLLVDREHQNPGRLDQAYQTIIVFSLRAYVAEKILEYRNMRWQKEGGQYKLKPISSAFRNFNTSVERFRFVEALLAEINDIDNIDALIKAIRNKRRVNATLGVSTACASLGRTLNQCLTYIDKLTVNLGVVAIPGETGGIRALFTR